MTAPKSSCDLAEMCAGDPRCEFYARSESCRSVIPPAVKHPRCTYDGPHTAHDFVTHVEPITFPIPPHLEGHVLEQLWCAGEPMPLEQQGVCNCESYEPCYGECCGPGNCTCSVLGRPTP